jgi:hypothetical protein
MTDLWPTDLQATDLIAPYTIAKAQGKIRGKRTKNLLVGRIHRTSPGKFDFGYIFFIASHPLSYQYNLFQFYYGAGLYPVTIIPDSAIQNELFPDIKTITAQSEEEFMEILKKIFASEKTKRLITAILTQVQE